MKNILKRYWIRDVGRAIFVKQYQVSSSSGLFKFSGSCATQDINREIWCDTRSQVVCWAGSIPRGECECFATWGNVVFWILESGLYLLLPEGKTGEQRISMVSTILRFASACASFMDNLTVSIRPKRSIETIALFDQWSGTLENHRKRC